MSLTSAVVFDPYPVNVWVALRSDGQRGSGTASDPLNGGLSFGSQASITLSRSVFEGIGDTSPQTHGFANGDIVRLSGATGVNASVWNRMFTVYDVNPERTTFRFGLGSAPQVPTERAIAALVTFRFDEIMRVAPPHIRVHIGPGEFLTRGYAVIWDKGWQPKPGQKIVGAGFDVTTLKLVGAGLVKDGDGNLIEQHYHAIGMPVESSDAAPVTPLEQFEVSRLTIDCNLDNQPLRGSLATYAPVACGAVRILGTSCRVHDIKVINWGTRSRERGCHVIEICGASAADIDNIFEGQQNGIEDCIAVQPSQQNAGITTVLHLSSLMNRENYAQAFHHACYMRRNFVDCRFLDENGVPSPSALVTSGTGTTIESGFGVFVGKRPHNRTAKSFLLFHNPRNPRSFWNGYFEADPYVNGSDHPLDPYRLKVTLDLSVPDGEADSTFVVIGADFRGLAVHGGNHTVIEQNQVHNCWIGGPYQSGTDDEIDSPSNLLDLFRAQNTRSAIVRDNHYRNVAVGPYFDMGELSSAVDHIISYNAMDGVATVNLEEAHRLWIGARVKIESAPDQRYEGIHEVMEVHETGTEFYFNFQLAAGLDGMGPAGPAIYRVVSGTDLLVIEGNQVNLLDFDETEFAIKGYPLADSPSGQMFRACGIIVADNELEGLFAHRAALIRNNKINYVENQLLPSFYGAGTPVGIGMQFAGIKRLQVTHNVVNLNEALRIRTFRCGTVRPFNNRKPNGEIIPVRILGGGSYDDPETLIDDAAILAAFR